MHRSSWQIRNGSPRDTTDWHCGTLFRLLAVSEKRVISKTDRALVRKKFPNSYVFSLQETIDQMRETIAAFQGDDDDLFVAEIINAFMWDAGAQEVRAAVGEGPQVIRAWINQAKPLPGKNQTRALIHLRRAIDSVLAKKQRKQELWNGACSEDGSPDPSPVSSAAIRATVTAILPGVKPHPRLPGAGQDDRRSPSPLRGGSPDLPATVSNGQGVRPRQPRFLATGHPGFSMDAAVFEPDLVPSLKVPKEDYPQMLMKEIDQAASICKGASPEEAQDYGRGLYMYMSKLAAAHGLLPLMLRIDTSKQLANMLTVHSPHLANEPQSAVEALKS